MSYQAILIDPPWPSENTGQFKGQSKRPAALPYPVMSLEEIAALPVPRLAAPAAHLWLWTTNAFLPAGFDLIRQWGFKYLCPVHWVKPSGFGAWWVHRTQTLLFAYQGKLRMYERFRPNVLFAAAGRHSQKPECTYDLIEAVSPGPYLELFARRGREGWHVWGNEVEVRLTDAAQSLLNSQSKMTL